LILQIENGESAFFESSSDESVPIIFKWIGIRIVAVKNSRQLQRIKTNIKGKLEGLNKSPLYHLPTEK
jgi:hypothetical protein